MTDLELVHAAADTYDVAAAWDRVWNADGVWMFYRSGVLAFRGSKTPEDWTRDLRAFPSYESGLGFVESGFMLGMRTALEEWQAAYPAISPWLTGHSLGGARAALLGALLIAMKGVLPLGLVTFGSPRPGFYKLRRVLRQGNFPMRSYVNEADPVPDLPPHVAKVLPYIHPEKVIEINAGPAPGDTSIFAAHHVSRYVAGIAALG